VFCEIERLWSALIKIGDGALSGERTWWVLIMAGWRVLTGLSTEVRINLHFRGLCGQLRLGYNEWLWWIGRRGSLLHDKDTCG
jgi:hypothetical protein